jgi:PPM family protein phosphatase
MAQLAYQSGLRTDKGQQRSNNEDAGAILELPGADAAFVVCDGMGGMRAGEVASGETVRVVGETLREFFAGRAPDPLKALGEAFRRANDHVNALNARDRAPGGVAATGETTRYSATPAETQGAMGTTCVAGVVVGETLYLAHAGDSRAYRWRRGQLAPLTEDHSFVAQEVKAGHITEAEARVSRFRNVITQAIGLDQKVEPDFQEETLEPGDVLLVCSDGLTTMLEDTEIAAVMNGNGFRKATVERAAGLLVDAANRKGGHDNITVYLLRAGGADGNGTEGTQVMLDMDAPVAERRVHPLIWILIGALLLAGLIALLLTLKPVRDRLFSALSGSPDSPTRKAVQAARRDFSKLSYDEPSRLNDRILARGDLLTYSPGVGLYFVAQATGKVALITPDGEVPRSVEVLETAPGVPGKVPTTRVFLTSDPQGNVYISYTARRVVEKKSATGKLLATLTGFEQPEAVAVDEVGNVYVVDFNQIKICRARLPGEKPAPSAFATPTPEPTKAPARPAATPATPKGR